MNKYIEPEIDILKLSTENIMTQDGSGMPPDENWGFGPWEDVGG